MPDPVPTFPTPIPSEPRPSGGVTITLSADEVRDLKRAAAEGIAVARLCADGQNSDQTVKPRVMSRIVNALLDVNNTVDRLLRDAG